MIQQETILKVADNSGAKTVKCIKVLGGYKKKTANLGDVIVVSVQELRNKAKLTSKVKKGEVYKGLVVRTKRKINKKDGTKVFYDKQTEYKNAVVLINKKGNPVATRITETVPLRLKKKQFVKILSISAGLV